MWRREECARSRSIASNAPEFGETKRGIKSASVFIYRVQAAQARKLAQQQLTRASRAAQTYQLIIIR